MNFRAPTTTSREHALLQGCAVEWRRERHTGKKKMRAKSGLF